MHLLQWLHLLISSNRDFFRSDCSKNLKKQWNILETLSWPPKSLACLVCKTLYPAWIFYERIENPRNKRQIFMQEMTWGWFSTNDISSLPDTIHKAHLYFYSKQTSKVKDAESTASQKSEPRINMRRSMAHWCMVFILDFIHRRNNHLLYLIFKPLCMFGLSVRTSPWL